MSKKKKKKKVCRCGFGLHVPRGVVLKGSLEPTGESSTRLPGEATDRYLHPGYFNEIEK